MFVITMVTISRGAPILISIMAKFVLDNRYFLMHAHLFLLSLCSTMSHVKVVVWGYFKMMKSIVVVPFVVKGYLRRWKTVKTFNTTNLINHVRKKHPSDYKDYESKKKNKYK